MGLQSVEVCNKPTVSLLSTGNEVIRALLIISILIRNRVFQLVEFNEANLSFGQIRDCNRPMLSALLSQLGYFIIDAEIAKDK